MRACAGIREGAALFARGLRVMDGEREKLYLQSVPVAGTAASIARECLCVCRRDTSAMQESRESRVDSSMEDQAQREDGVGIFVP
jgi:hypothetical protein